MGHLGGDMDAISSHNCATTVLEHNQLSIFVLTIDPEGGKRRRSATRELERLGFQGSFVKGFKKTDPAILENYDARRNLLASKRSLTHGEIAVYCGHRAIWREFLKTESECALVLEDDFQIVDVDAFSNALNDCLAHRAEWGMIKFFDFRPKRVKRRKKLGRTEIVKYKYAASGAVAYLINRETANRLLARRKFFRAVDEDFSWEWEFDLNIWSVNPNIVSDGGDILGGSLLENDRIGRKRHRNVFRSLWGNVIQGYKLCRSLRV